LSEEPSHFLAAVRPVGLELLQFCFLLVRQTKFGLKVGIQQVSQIVGWHGAKPTGAAKAAAESTTATALSISE
jgi:hypothetical protein